MPRRFLGILALALTAPLSAQSARRISLQASGLYVGVFGDAFEGLKNGPGFEAQGLVHIP